MFVNLSVPTRQILTGNLMLVGCCIFYLAWWLIAFKPIGGIKGFKSGWLLIPAFILGLMAVIWILRGCNSVDSRDGLFSSGVIIAAGIVIYLILLLVTGTLMHRQVTSELILIIGWTMLTFVELNALFIIGNNSKMLTIILLVITIVATVAGLICYLLYYNLDGVKGYVDGMIPLILIAVMMSAITICTAAD